MKIGAKAQFRKRGGRGRADLHRQARRQQRLIYPAQTYLPSQNFACKNNVCTADRPYLTLSSTKRCTARGHCWNTSRCKKESAMSCVSRSRQFCLGGPRSRSRIGVRYLRRHGPGACWRQSAAGNSTSAMCEDLLGLMGNEWERDEPRAADWVAREGS
jgi:hypothetical protein